MDWAPARAAPRMAHAFTHSVADADWITTQTEWRAAYHDLEYDIFSDYGDIDDWCGFGCDDSDYDCNSSPTEVVDGARSVGSDDSDYDCDLGPAEAADAS